MFTRADDRTAAQLREVTIETGWSAHAEGSAVVSFGDTKVLCTASFTEGVPRWLKGKNRGWVTAEYAMLPRATGERTARESVRGKVSGRTQEISRLIGRSLRAVVDTKALGENTIVIDCDVIQADGGTRTAAITGAWVALAQAIEAYYAADYRFIDTEEDLIYQGSNPLSDHLAEKAIRLISQNLRMAVHQGHNLEARSNMLLGSLFSALSFTNSGTSLLHALAYPVAEKTKKAHGEIIGLLLPYVMQYNAAACMDKMAKIAEWLGENDPRLSLADKVKRSTDAVFRLLHDLRMPVKLADIGIKKEHIPEMVDKSLTIDRLIRINPKIPRADEVKSLLYRAL